MTSCAIIGGTSGLSVSNGGTGFVTCAARIVCGAPENGVLPVSISYAITPSA